VSWGRDPEGNEILLARGRGCAERGPLKDPRGGTPAAVFEPGAA
jgi:hypothetical protein